MSTSGGEKTFNDAAEAAIARVLAVEREARDALAATEVEATGLVEAARRADRAIAERAERRIRAVTAAFGSDVAARLSRLDADAAQIAAPHVLVPAELAALEAAARAVARELVGGDA